MRPGVTRTEVPKSALRIEIVFYQVEYNNLLIYEHRKAKISIRLKRALLGIRRS